MSELLFDINEPDNVGDVLGKINFNFLKLNNDLFDLEVLTKQNLDVIKNLDYLMDRMDLLISQIDFDKYQDLYTSVNFLSSYWNNVEFTVQYPFNPDNGFTSFLVGAGGLGELLGSTDAAKHIEILSNALINSKLPNISDVVEAKNALNTNGVVMVNRNDNGEFVSWEFLKADNLLKVAVDKYNNFYYDGRLVDVYDLPYYSVITPTSTDVYSTVLPDYNAKILLQGGTTPVEPDKASIYNNILIEYEPITYQDYDAGGTIVPITKYEPRAENFSNIILEYSSEFQSKILQINRDLEGAVGENSKAHNMALDFLKETHPAVSYPDNTTINVLFLLYNMIGADSMGETVVETLYWDVDTLAVPKQNLEIVKKSTISKIAPTSNTTYNLTYNKQNIYIEKIINVKYKKGIEIKETIQNISGIERKITEQLPVWKFKGINIGKKYSPHLFLENITYPKYEMQGTPSKIYTG